MASDIGDGDYLGAYRRFFVDFLDKVNPEDQLPIKTSGHDVTEGEIVGEIIRITLQYLDQQLCPPCLQCYIVHLVIEEIKATCRKQPESCGFRTEEKTYEPLKLMQAVTGKVNEICQRYLENSRLALLPPPPSTPMPLATASAIRNNRRKMEDRHVILHDLNTIFNIKDDSIASYYAVFDGHAGYQAAVFCATHLHQYLAESRHYPTDPERALRDAFLTTDARFIGKSTRQTLSSGTTAVCALILNKKLYVAWAGDSQAALAKRGVVTQLVNPHKPDRNDERERVEEMGGTVMHLGIWRVNGNLAVSRAIGDAQYKPYVTGDPEIRCISLDGQEDFLIIACDGLWDCVTENEAATLVYRDLCRDPYDYASTSQRLVEYAKNQGSIDNITVIVVFLSTPRQIALRSNYGNPALADVGMNNMEPDNRYMSNANGQYDVNSTFGKQQTTGNNDSSELRMEDDYANYENKSSNGKRHENGNQVADYDAEDDDDDLGPETDVDAVDDVSEPTPTLANVSRQLFTEKQDPSEIYRNEDCAEDDSPPSPNAIKPNQRALIPDADNVGDSEDSEDEWNYYRIDPNKEKEEEAGAAGFSPLPKAENENIDNLGVSSPPEERKDTIDLEEKEKGSKNDTDSSDDSESDSEKENLENNEPVETDTRADLILNPDVTSKPAKLTDSESETEKIDEQEEKKIREDEDNKENEEEDMDFQLNPNAAEFVPVSPTLTMPMRMDLDVPIAGSPLKQTPPMDDIKIPSRREFENEVRHRPHEIEDKSFANGRLLDDLEDALESDKPKEETTAVNLDESEVSSTKAEFGDESSFLTANEFHRTGVSTMDGSYTGSCEELDDSAVDLMTKSHGPGDFVTLGDPVDLNAVHDLTDVDLVADEADVTQEAEDETREKNLRNVDTDTEFEKPCESFDPFSNNQTDNLPVDSPSSTTFPQSQVEQMFSELENQGNVARDEYPMSSETFQDEAKTEEERSVEPMMEFDDSGTKQLSTHSQDSSATTAEIQDETSVNTKLLEMDLEDRGSQDCGFEKYNQPMSEMVEETMDSRTDIVEPTEYLSSPVPQENLMETFDQPESLATENVTGQIEESQNIDKMTESFSELCADQNSTSSRHSSVPDVPVLHNPLDLEVSAPSTNSREDLILEDDSFRAISEARKVPESPDVGLSPLVETKSNNPFDPIEFGDSFSSSKPQEINIATGFEDTLERKLVEENESHPEEQCLLQPEMISVTEEPANVSTELKLSESLQEFTGLEKQLNPEAESNGVATLDNLMDIRNEDTAPETIMNPEIVEAIPEKIEERVSESVGETESKVKVEEKANTEDGSSVVAAAAAAVAGAAVAAVATSAATKTTKAKPTGKVAPKSVGATKTSSVKSTPTSPTKPATTAAARTSTLTAAKRTAATSSTAARPNKLETVGKTGSATSTSGKPVAATTAKNALKTNKPTSRPSAGTAVPKAKTTGTASSTKGTTTAPEKKPTSNGEAIKLSVTTSNRTSLASGRVSSSGSKPLVKSSTASAGKATFSMTTTTTTTTTSSASSRLKSASLTATASRSTSKTTTSTTGTVGTTTQRPKTAPSTGAANLVAKSRTASSTKSPITEKQIKETANKQISSSRTTTTTTSGKTARTSGSATTTASGKRLTSSKSTSASATTNTVASTPVIPPPIKKPGSATRVTGSKTPTTNGKSHTAKTTQNSTNKTKVVVQNGVCTAEGDAATTATTMTTTTTSTTTTTAITESDKNEEDVPKKDISPVEPPTDNQLILIAD